MCIGVAFCNYGKFTSSSSSWVFLAFFIYFHMHLPFQSLCLFFPACYTGWDFQSTLSRRESGRLVLLLILGEECSVFHFMYEVSIRLSEMLFIRLKKYPYNPSLQSYNREWVLHFVKNFLHLFIFFCNLYFLQMRWSWFFWNGELHWFFKYVNQSYIPGICSACMLWLLLLFPLEVQ